MRLNSIQIETIKKYTYQVFGKEAKVYLFGSRISDEKKGGDIDLLILPNKNINATFYLEKIKLLARLKINLGDQKIDIIVKQLEDNRSIVKQALLEGIAL